MTWKIGVLRAILSKGMPKIFIKTKAELELMRGACRVTSEILDEVGEIIKPGISTEDINTFVHELTLKKGAKPATLNYRGYPKSVCTSVNEVVCHGIPSPYQMLSAGDIINVDVTSIFNGFFGDSSRMYYVGGQQACTSEAIELVEHTKKALYAGIEAVKPGAHVGDIGSAVSAYIHALKKNYGIVREYTGHGIGRSFHEEPQIVHDDRKGSGPVLKVGMTFTIEPMINAGVPDTVLSRVDGWTVRTKDNKLSAQWEHTVAVVEGGVEILTVSSAG